MLIQILKVLWSIYYDDINKLLDIREGSIIDRYKFDKIKNTGLLSNEKLLEEVEKNKKL